MARIKKLTAAQEKARTEYFARRRTRVITSIIADCAAWLKLTGFDGSDFDEAVRELMGEAVKRVGNAAATGACDDDDGVDIEVS